MNQQRHWNFVCPIYGDTLSDRGDALVSRRGMSYPIVAGVPVIVAGVEVQRKHEPVPEAVIDQLLDAIMMHPVRKSELGEAFNYEFKFEEDWIQTEADQFLERVAASHGGLRSALMPQAHTAPAVTDVGPAVRLSSVFMVSRLRPEEALGINLRVQNTGTTILSSEGEQPVLLSYHWIDSEGVAHEGHRTPLIDDLLPGRTFSQPIFIVTPAARGSWRLRIRAVQEGVRWFEESQVEFAVVIDDGPSTVDEPSWTRTGRHYDYMADQAEAIRLLADWRDTRFNRPVNRVVEVGGNANPIIDRLEAPNKINFDIDPYGMIVGKLMRKTSGSTVEFVTADAMALPLVPKTVDLLVMSATFHHFPDPPSLLSRLREFLHHDGLLCLMCEPIGHVQRETVNAEFLGEIRKGVNEQSFALWEYQQMFDTAGLDVVVAQIDVGSAKFALRPRHAA